MSYHYLEMTRGTEVGRRFALPEGAVSIGRSSQNTITLPSAEKSVSGHHAIIYNSPERILIQDLQSTNGIFVNEVKATEIELFVGNEIGFGQTGPRLKLIESATELPLEAREARSASHQSTGQKTVDDEGLPGMTAAKDSTFSEKQDRITQIKLDVSAKSPAYNPSLTMAYEQKLADKSISPDEMKRLMKDGKRMGKVLDHGSLGATQTTMLRTVYAASESMRRQGMYILGIVVLISICACAFLGIRAFQYKQLLDKAQSLRKDMDDYDKKIAAVNVNPDANEAKLKQLISEMEKKEIDFQQVQSRIGAGDAARTYSDPLAASIDRILRRYGESDYHIPREMVDRVRFHLQEYSGGLHDIVSRYIQRKSMYFPMIQKIFKEKNVPVELAYVAMLESGFNPMALSHAGARGLWQFMPETGRRYSLVVGGAVDERTDPEKASYAAAQYFKELISIFGGKSSVMLCMAAYNAGEGRVIGALRKIDDPMRNRDFWYIYRMGYLAQETNEYIPRVIALMIISENPQQYGFTSTASSSTAVSSERDFVEVDYKVQ